MKKLISILFLLISLNSFGQYEKLFSDKNIAPYNLILKDKFIWLDKEVVRDSLVYAELKTDSIRFRYFDGNCTNWFYVPELSGIRDTLNILDLKIDSVSNVAETDPEFYLWLNNVNFQDSVLTYQIFQDLIGIRDTLQFHSDSLAIAFDSISQYSSRLIELEGLDTTGVFHHNRHFLDSLSYATLQDVLIGVDTSKIITPLVAAQRDSLINVPYIGALDDIYTDYNIAGDSIFANYFNILLMDNAHEADPLFQDWNRTDGINIETKQIWDLDEVLSFYALETDITGGVLDADFTSVTINGEPVVVDSDLSNYVEWADTTNYIATKYDIENVEVDLSSYTQFSDLDTLSFLRSYTETDPIYSGSSWFNTTNNSENWNTAHGWGDHSGAGYLTSELDPIFTSHLANTITSSDTTWWGTNYWNMTATGIHHNGNVAVGDYAPDYGRLRVTATGGNDWINYNYHRSSGGNGMYIGVTTGFSDERKLLSLNRGISATHEFYANGKVRFFNYGSGSTFTGTVENYLATDANGNLIVASGTSGSGDDWGRQVVQTDATLTGDGTSTSPLSVVGGGGGSLWESSSGFINPINDENILIGGSAYPLVRFVSADFPTRHAQLYFDGSSLRGNYSDGSTLYDVISWGQLGLQTTGLLLSSSTNYNNVNGSIRYDGADLLGRVGGVWKSLTAGASGTGVTTFLELTDTPSAYTGNAGKVVKVNSGASGLEFGDIGTGYWTRNAASALVYPNLTSDKVLIGTSSTLTTDAQTLLQIYGNSYVAGNITSGSYLRIHEVASPSTPASGWGLVYPKTDGKLYFKNDSGTEYDLTEVGSGTGGGDVYKVGTPVNNQVGVWTGNGTIEGDADLTFDGTNLVVTGNVTSDQNRTQSTLTNPSSMDYRLGAKVRVNLTTSISDMTITNLPDGSEGSLEVYQDATGNRTFTIAGSTGYTTLKRVGPKTEINLAANSHTTIAYWRTGDILYYGFVDDRAISSGGSSLWTDGGDYTYLTSTSDNLSIGSSVNNGFKLYVDGDGYFTTALHVDGFVSGNALRITEEQSTITGITGTEGGVFRVGTDNLAYWVSDYNDGNKVYDITGSTKPIKVSGTSRNLYINDHTFINTSPNPSGLENPIYLPASPHTGKIFVIVNRHTDDVRLRVGTSDVNYYTPSGTSNIVAGQSMVTIQFDGTNWYQIQ